MVDETAGTGAALRPEVQLLICCARTQLEPRMVTRLARLLQDGLDWPYVLEQARRHAMVPLLLKSLEAIGPEHVPQDELNALRAGYRASSWTSLKQMGELLEILRALQAEGIPALPYKGPLLALTAYGDVNLRQSTDLDILLPRADMDRGNSLLQERGYRPDPGLGPALGSVQYEHGYFHPEKEILVELHWGLTRQYFPFPLSFERLWASRLTISLSGRDVPLLPPESLLLLLCVHGGKHAWERLSWIADVAELLKREPGLDWPQVQALAHHTGSRRMLHLGLLLARDLLDAPLPEPLWRQVQAGRVVPRLDQDVRRWLWTPPEGTSGLMQVDLFRLRLRERLRDKAAYARYIGAKRLRPNEQDRQAAPLPLTHYALRPLRLLRQYGVDSLKDVIRNVVR